MENGSEDENSYYRSCYFLLLCKTKSEWRNVKLTSVIKLRCQGTQLVKATPGKRRARLSAPHFLGPVSFVFFFCTAQAGDWMESVNASGDGAIPSQGRVTWTSGLSIGEQCPSQRIKEHVLSTTLSSVDECPVFCPQVSIKSVATVLRWWALSNYNKKQENVFVPE